MTIHTIKEAEDLVYQSFLNAQPFILEADDALTRDISLARQLLDAVGSPDKGLRTILVTGSKGKGSTARLIAALLSHMGWKVGLFTSPHLVHFTERIRVDGQAISEEDFIRLMGKAAQPIEEISNSLSREHYLGPIGITLTIACLYFKEQKTDIQVIECGRGGRYDETNVLENEWAVITPISLEHVKQLGPTLREITDHKLGIVKSITRAAFIGRQKENVQHQIEARLHRRPVFYYERAFAPSNVKMMFSGTSFDVKTERMTYKDLLVPLLGAFQAENAALAIKVCEEITEHPLDVELVREAFRKVQWPGRCEVIATQPPTLLDGAIHRESAMYLSQLIDHLEVSRIVTLIAVSDDKDYEGVIDVCAQFSEQLIITEPEHSHKTFPVEALPLAKRKQQKSVRIIPLREAIKAAKALHPELILIVGTQTAIGEVKKVYGHSLLNIGK
ncbi:dihydrofolate synthase/folylpolyglutamate synthase [Pullulanibacillus pueri]|uniref:Bifunctional folylpolyglutamate synthase/dihydrofolate synthase n=1 Tax=Pullulanibacillus pueri TaxID=1437324 RepID=A0A8J2ZUF5_9BACL|nr:Mur ligase family protein [Pullulanibacillus pueri]MBM7680758.1 dihydrofolate synthase/folylpolyglutamate synthase [Pullulanibacillus pueri]GGH78223.1 bifunctional folylpolyglutamate synthase/dihydrofolate synthase [Pullulanibacillus pueri]